MPGSEFPRRDLIPCKIPFMQTEQLGLRHFLELRLIVGIDLLFCKRLNFAESRFSVHSRTDNGPDNFSQRITVFQPEWIRFTKRLPYSGITRRGPLIRPDEYIPEQFNTVEFIHTKNGVGIDVARHICKRKRAQIVFDKRYVCR